MLQALFFIGILWWVSPVQGGQQHWEEIKEVINEKFGPFNNTLKHKFILGQVAQCLEILSQVKSGPLTTGQVEKILVLQVLMRDAEAYQEVVEKIFARVHSEKEVAVKLGLLKSLGLSLSSQIPGTLSSSQLLELANKLIDILHKTQWAFIPSFDDNPQLKEDVAIFYSAQAVILRILARAEGRGEIAEKVKKFVQDEVFKEARVGMQSLSSHLQGVFFASKYDWVEIGDPTELINEARDRTSYYRFLIEYRKIRAH